MKAKKDNKVYRINTEQEKQRYLKEGYDIYNDEGELVEYSPLKKARYSDYDKAVKELEAVKKENELLRQQVKELETVKAASGKAGK